MNINSYIIRNRRITINGTFVPDVVCNDGFTMSVQASNRHYSGLAVDGSWASVEVGFPSQPEAMLGYSADGEVWGRVAVGTVDEIISRHGGYANY